MWMGEQIIVLSTIQGVLGFVNRDCLGDGDEPVKESASSHCLSDTGAFSCPRRSPDPRRPGGIFKMPRTCMHTSAANNAGPFMERSADWISQAHSDLDHARHDVEVESRQLSGWACFSAQQAAEKATKAVFQKIVRR